MRNRKSGEVACYDEFAANQRALNSAVECHPHTVEVIGSNPIAPTTLQYCGNLAEGSRTAVCLFARAPVTYPGRFLRGCDSDSQGHWR
jgi:hypothetical protein